MRRTTLTETLEIVHEDDGPDDGPVVLLLHGWPDDARAWKDVTPRLNAAGFRTIAPWLRGFGPTRFRSAQTFRDGRAEAVAQDAIDLADALRIERFAVVGHDWGARAAYALAAVIPDRLTALAALSIGYPPRGLFVVPETLQARAWWYQWLLSVDHGVEAVSRDPKSFARFQWETWSPSGWFDSAEFDLTAESFLNPDWVAITVHGYRSRWRETPVDPRYNAVRARVTATETLAVPTLMLQGELDGTVLAASTEGKERYFTAGYTRQVLPGVGHFPSREAPEAVTRALLAHLGR